MYWYPSIKKHPYQSFDPKSFLPFYHISIDSIDVKINTDLSIKSSLLFIFLISHWIPYNPPTLCIYRGVVWTQTTNNGESYYRCREWVVAFSLMGAAMPGPPWYHWVDPLGFQYFHPMITRMLNWVPLLFLKPGPELASYI